ncbi:MAG: DUF2239 family protein [Rhodoferax sp.]
MSEWIATPCTAFADSRLLASGELGSVALAVKKLADQGGREPILVFDDRTSALIELDLRGTAADVTRRLEQITEQTAGADSVCPALTDAHRGPGRPRLGVVAREVTLLPRHWEWLACQPGGASVALRKLVEEARRSHGGKDRKRQAQEVAYRFMVAIGGHQIGFEEATRALFAGDTQRFAEQLRAWPADVREHAQKLAQTAFEPEPNAEGTAR